MKRRVFIEKGCIAVALGAIGTTISCSDDEESLQPNLGEGITIDLNDPTFESLNETESWVLHPTLNLILVNFEGTIRAFTSVCTHQQCSRDWSFGTTIATCRCHTSQFDYEGRVVRGPAKEDLASFQVTQNDDAIIIR